MLGGYYEHSKRESFTVGRGGFGLPVPFDPAIGNSSVGYWPDDFVYSNTYSAFGQVLWDIVDGVQLSGGVRYTKETKRAELQNVYVNPGLPLRALQLPVGTQLRGQFKDSNWSPEVHPPWQARNSYVQGK